MIRARADRLFDRYRRTGDPGALAALFDRTAPELWRVATYLARDPHVVEDAVQTTFLKAIEDAGRWDGRLPVLPWLIGILTNQVRTHQRRMQRANSPLPADTAGGSNPAADAASSELHAEVGRAMQRLAAPYRSVLEQHLVLGLAPAEIAARLGLAPGTVRVRLHRGLDRLRQLLPPGFAAAGLVAVGVPAKRLAAMRHVVVQRAIDVGSTLAAGAGLSLLAWFGGLAMQKTTMGLVAAALALAGWFTWDPFAAPAARGEPAAPPGALIATSPGSGPNAPDGVALAASPARTAIPSTHALPAGSLRVRVVRSDTKGAIAGAQLEWSGRHIDRGVADARGEWVIEDDAGPGTLTLPRLGVHKRYEVVAGVETLVVLELSLRVRVDLRVVDGERSPIAGARVFGTVREGHLRWELLGHTDRDGSFRHAWVFERAEVWAEADGMVPSEVVGAEARGEPWRRTVVLRERAATVAGVVLDTNDVPIADTLVAIQGSDPRRHNPPLPILVRTDDHGRFASASVPPGPVHAFALLGGTSATFGNADRAARALGEAVLDQTTELVIRLCAGARVLVRAGGDLAHAEGGASVVAGVAEPALEGNLANALPGARCQLDAGGGGALGPLMPGRYRLTLRAGNRECAHLVDLTDGETFEWQPVLDRALPLRLRCLDAGGQPLVYWRVRVARSDQAHLTLTVETDAQGRCTVEGLADAPCAVSVFQPGRWESAVRFADVRPGDGERTLRLGGDDRLGTVRGRLVADGGGPLPAALRVEVCLAGHPNGAQPALGSATPDSGGAFVIGSLPPGVYFAVVRAGSAVVGNSENRDLATAGEVDFGAIPIWLMGKLVLRVRGVSDTSSRRFVLLLLHEGRFGQHMMSENADQPTVDAMPAGTWEFLLWGEDIAPARLTARVVANETATIDVTCSEGVPCTLTFDPAMQREAQFVTIRDAGGNAIVSAIMRRSAREVRRGLLPGRYTLEAEGETSRVKVTRTLNVVAGQTASVVFTTQ